MYDVFLHIYTYIYIRMVLLPIPRWHTWGFCCLPIWTSFSLVTFFWAFSLCQAPHTIFGSSVSHCNCHRRYFRFNKWTGSERRSGDTCETKADSTQNTPLNNPWCTGDPANMWMMSWHRTCSRNFRGTPMC